MSTVSATRERKGALGMGCYFLPSEAIRRDGVATSAQNVLFRLVSPLRRTA